MRSTENEGMMEGGSKKYKDKGLRNITNLVSTTYFTFN